MSQRERDLEWLKGIEDFLSAKAEEKDDFEYAFLFWLKEADLYGGITGGGLKAGNLAHMFVQSLKVALPDVSLSEVIGLVVKAWFVCQEDELVYRRGEAAVLQ